MAAIAFSLNKIAIFSYYYTAVNASIAGIAFVSDGSEAMRFKSFQQQFFKHKRINFPQVVNFFVGSPATSLCAPAPAAHFAASFCVACAVLNAGRIQRQAVRWRCKPIE